MDNVIRFLILVGGILPLIGLVRVAVRARRNRPQAERIPATVAVEEGRQTGLYPIYPYNRAAVMADEAPLLEWKNIKWDLGLVGGGIVSGTIGGLLSLI